MQNLRTLAEAQFHAQRLGAGGRAGVRLIQIGEKSMFAQASEPRCPSAF